MPKFLDCLYAIAWTIVGMLLAENGWNENAEKDRSWRNMNWHLGAEYNEIAKAIYAGRGYADPFRTESGPTAWMPPVLPYALAAMYWLTDFQPQAVVEIVLGLKAIAIAITGTIILSESRRINILWLGRLVFPLALLANFTDFFLVTHDLWLLLFCVNLLWLGLVHFWKASGATHAIGWGLFGGWLALSSPAVGTAWAVATTIRSLSIWRTQKTRPARSNDYTVLKRKPNTAIVSLVMAGVTSIAVTTPWTLRNRTIFGVWIPIKSNAIYELWQSQCLDDDGVLDQQITSSHPYAGDGEQRQRYVELGEQAFLKKKSELAWTCIQSNPSGFLRRLGHRATAALIWYYPWVEPRAEYRWFVYYKRTVYPLTFLAILISIIKARKLSLQFSCALTITIIVLLPYIIVSYYDRYASPLLAMKCILILHGFKAIIDIPRKDI